MNQNANETTDQGYALELVGLKKSFGHVEVLKDINLGVKRARPSASSAHRVAASRQCFAA